MNTAASTPTVEPLADISPAAELALIAMLAKKKPEVRAKASPGVYVVDEVIGFRVRARVNVGRDFDQRNVGKADPWGLVSVLLEELQEKAIAAGESGLDLDRLVRLSMCVNDDLKKTAKERADKIVGALKAETWQTYLGHVTLSQESLEVLK